MEMEAMVSRTDLVFDFCLTTSFLIPWSEIARLFQIDGSASNYIIPSLQLDNDWFIFSSVSKFLSSITPNDMPLSKIKAVILFTFNDSFSGLFISIQSTAFSNCSGMLFIQKFQFFRLFLRLLLMKELSRVELN